MIQNLEQIFELETAEKYNVAYSEHQKLILKIMRNLKRGNIISSY